MTTRDEWFAVHASGSTEVPLAETQPGPAGSAAVPSAGFLVEPEAMPAVRAAFQEAVDQMRSVNEAAHDIAFLASSGGANPVVDKYMAAMVDRAVGETGSMLTSADSAISAYQDVLNQLDRAMETYQENEDQAVRRFTRG